MLVILFMTGIAIRGRAFVSAILMTRLTCHLCMFTFQFEGCKIMVEPCGRPSIGRMTIAAIRTKTALVRLILTMTRETILWSRLQVCDCARIEVAFRADRFCMLTRQLKCKLVVIEIISIAIHSIVADETVRAECEEMCLGKGNVHLAVAVLAGVRSEPRDVAMMTVIARERFTRRCTLVSV